MKTDCTTLEQRVAAHIETIRAETPDPLQELMQEQVDAGNTVTGRDRQHMKRNTFAVRYGSNNDLARTSKTITTGTTHKM